MTHLISTFDDPKGLLKPPEPFQENFTGSFTLSFVLMGKEQRNRQQMRR
jgi:hypothetical protein